MNVNIEVTLEQAFTGVKLPVTFPNGRQVQVKVPAGIKNGTRIRLMLDGLPPTECFVYVNIALHGEFLREGADLFRRVWLSPEKARVGHTVEIEGIDGLKKVIKIPRGTTAGEQFRLKGQGFSILRSDSRGDLYIECAIDGLNTVPRSKSHQTTSRLYNSDTGFVISLSPLP